MFTRPLMLVAIDRATDLERMIDATVSLARTYTHVGVASRIPGIRDQTPDCDVHVIRVVPDTVVPLDVRLGMLEPLVDRRAGANATRAALAPSLAGEGIRVRGVTLRGAPAEVVPAYARRHRAALLVVEQGYGSSPLWPGGRVVDALARRSPVPVLVLPKRQRFERKGPRLRRILAAADFSAASAAALRTAVALARRHEARVTLLHALHERSQRMVFTGSEAWTLVQRLQTRRQAVADHLRWSAAFFGAADVDAEVATGVAGGAILEAAARGEVDLIVMGATHRSWLDRLVSGSTLQRVLRRATAPVLVAPVVAGMTWPGEAATESSRNRGCPSPDGRCAA